jgi:hypothetical protein
MEGMWSPNCLISLFYYANCQRWNYMLEKQVNNFSTIIVVKIQHFIRQKAYYKLIIIIIKDKSRTFI